MSKSYRTCRHCLGSGCCHCGQHGQIRERVFARVDPTANARKLLGLVQGNRPVVSEVERTLAFLRS